MNNLYMMSKDTLLTSSLMKASIDLMTNTVDGYVQYLSESEHKVLNRYCGSLFLRHWASDDLVDHFKQFVVDNELDTNYLLHISMDGPNVNLAFQEK